MVKVKICGITNYKDAAAACRYGADALGFVFAKSRRGITPKKAKDIIMKLPPYVAAVGVFVDEKKGKVLKIARDCRLDLLQLHGDESPDYCKGLNKYYKIIKAVRVSGRDSLKGLGRYPADAFLLDSCVRGKSGGTGVKFDWSLAVKAKRSGKPVILAGGLDAGNVKSAINKVRPYAVDASSRLEAGPGRKDHGLMKSFIEKAKDIN
ncbi:MAG: phosphoribosylanthranilate isomerase [Candidatus Omnitrophica bacterium]|nr:phosphoribosylanthranilate isomerase [Candidatus Omnitrophota bacterium]MDD5310273.1 phosphoribosylanthranilate isomerase [Candidatus Omnitrophota bacterium]